MTDMDARMAALRARFVERAAGDRTRLLAAVAMGDLAEVHRLAHGVSGSGGVFGFPEVSEAACALEEAIDANAAAADIRLLCGRLMAQLEKVAQRA